MEMDETHLAMGMVEFVAQTPILLVVEVDVLPARKETATVDGVPCTKDHEMEITVTPEVP